MDKKPQLIINYAKQHNKAMDLTKEDSVLASLANNVTTKPFKKRIELILLTRRGVELVSLLKKRQNVMVLLLLIEDDKIVRKNT